MQTNEKPLLQKLDLTGKIVLTTLILACLNTVVLLSFLPVMSKVGSVINQVEATMDEFNRFF
jgi:hypothetical protein